MALNFFQADCQKMGLNFSWGDVTSIETDMLVISLSFLYNYDHLTLKLHQGKRSYPDEGWRFTGRFKVGSVPEISIALAASKKSKIKQNFVFDLLKLTLNLLSVKASINFKSLSSPSTKNYSCDYQPEMMNYGQY